VNIFSGYSANWTVRSLSARFNKQLDYYLSFFQLNENLDDDDVAEAVVVVVAEDDDDDANEDDSLDDAEDSLSFVSNDLFIWVFTFDGSFSKQCLHTGFESKS
jgi:hypothetical protein